MSELCSRGQPGGGPFGGRHSLVCLVPPAVFPAVHGRRARSELWLSEVFPVQCLCLPVLGEPVAGSLEVPEVLWVALWQGVREEGEGRWER